MTSKQWRPTAKQRLFVAEYAACLNATQAAIRAGYSERTARSIAAGLMRKPHILAAIDACFKALTMPATEILTRLTDIARGDIGDFINDTGRVDIAAVRRAGKLHLIRKITATAKGEITIELMDAQSALIQLGRHYKLFTDKFELDGVDLATLADDALEAIVKGKPALLDRRYALPALPAPPEAAWWDVRNAANLADTIN